MNLREDLEVALDELRPMLQADGADLQVTSIDADAQLLGLQLRIADATCAECLLPREDLVDVIAQVVRRHLPSIEGIELKDPREARSSRG